jgi:hypothetical protein
MKKASNPKSNEKFFQLLSFSQLPSVLPQQRPIDMVLYIKVIKEKYKGYFMLIPSY